MTPSKQICSTFLRLLVHFLSILILVSNIIRNIIINIGFGFIFAQLMVPFLFITKSFKRLREAFHQRKASLFQAPRQWGRRDAKVKLRYAKSWRGGKEEKFPLVLFSCSHFLNSARPTISEPRTGQRKAPGGSNGCFTKILDAGKSKLYTLFHYLHLITSSSSLQRFIMVSISPDNLCSLVQLSPSVQAVLVGTLCSSCHRPCLLFLVVYGGTGVGYRFLSVVAHSVSTV